MWYEVHYLEKKFLSLIFFVLYCGSLTADFFEGSEVKVPDSLDQYLNEIVDTRICHNYKSESPLNLNQAINLTLACNRNIQKHILNRVSENYALQVTKYKFKPNLNISTRAHYEKVDNDITTAINKSANVIPQFKILTPLGTIVNLDWENYVSNPNNINTFRNASRITIRQPLLKQSGIDYQTANIKNAEASNKFDRLSLYDQIANEVNNTIFLFRQIIQNHQQLETQQKSLDISKKLHNQTSALIQAGRLAQYELSQVESQVASQEINLADAKINLRQSYQMLANHLGIDSTNLKIQIDPSSTHLVPPINRNKVSLKNILSNNLNYQSLELQQENTERDYHVAFDQARWTLDLTASYQIEGFDNTYKRSLRNYFSFSDQKKFLGVEFDIPFDLNPNRGQAIVENKVRLKQIALDKKQLEQEIAADFQDKLYRQQILWDKLKLSQKSFNLKQANFEMARKKYEVGRLSAFELVKIQDEVEHSKVLENNNLIAYLNNETLLDKMLNITLEKWRVDIKIE